MGLFFGDEVVTSVSGGGGGGGTVYRLTLSGEVLTLAGGGWV